MLDPFLRCSLVALTVSLRFGLLAVELCMNSWEHQLSKKCLLHILGEPDFDNAQELQCLDACGRVNNQLDFRMSSVLG